MCCNIVYNLYKVCAVIVVVVHCNFILETDPNYRKELLAFIFMLYQHPILEHFSNVIQCSRQE